MGLGEYAYGTDFFDDLDQSARRSAHLAIRDLLDVPRRKSVIDDRYNAPLFVADCQVRRLPREIVAAGMPPTQPIPVVASLIWRARLAGLRRFSKPLVHRLARLKHRIVIATRT